ncbi:hypothetical protein Scep_002769 [Stephania cephalantha]|uniref:Uncharacterized protein n=1 Tax=Stephania cephalantha TaxID=152367 RepID=A0AAP0LAL1_9MAGN
MPESLPPAYIRRGTGSSVEEDHARTEETRRINAAEEVEAAEEEGLLCGERGGEWRRRRRARRSRREVRREEVAFLFAAERSGMSARSAERRAGMAPIVSAEEK